jgi:hypothetical protein
MSSSKSILRLPLLLHAVYTTLYGLWAILDPQHAWGGNLPLTLGLKVDTIQTIGTLALSQNLQAAGDATTNNSITSGLGQTAIGFYEILIAWRGDRISYASIACVRLLAYVILNRVWQWGLGWPVVDLNLVVGVFALGAAAL